MAKLVKVNLLPAAPPFQLQRRLLLTSGYVAALAVLGYLAVMAVLNVQAQQAQLGLLRQRTELTSRTAAREGQVAAAEAAGQARLALVQEINSVPTWTDILPDLLNRLPPGVTVKGPIKVERTAISFAGVARDYQDLAALKKNFEGFKWGVLAVSTPDWDLKTRQFSFTAAITPPPPTPTPTPAVGPNQGGKP